MKNIFRQNILFKLWYTFDSPYVKNFYLRILDPIDTTFNITPELRNDIYRYVYETRILKEFTSLMHDPKLGIDMEKVTKFYRPKGIEGICDFHGSGGLIYTPNYVEREEEKEKLALDQKSKTQSEQLAEKRDIDRITELYEKKSFKRFFGKIEIE